MEMCNNPAANDNARSKEICVWKKDIHSARMNVQRGTRERENNSSNKQAKCLREILNKWYNCKRRELTPNCLRDQPTNQANTSCISGSNTFSCDSFLFSKQNDMIVITIQSASYTSIFVPVDSPTNMIYIIAWIVSKVCDFCNVTFNWHGTRKAKKTPNKNPWALNNEFFIWQWNLWRRWCRQANWCLVHCELHFNFRSNFRCACGFFPVRF